MSRFAPLLDLALVIAAAGAAFALAGLADLSEAFTIWASRYERWQADELPLALVVLAGGFALFGLRRWREARDLAVTNRELARQLIGLQETERRHLARELHDHIGQSCNAVRVEAACLSQSAFDRDAVSAAAKRIAHIADALHELVGGLLRELRPAALDDAGLAAAVQTLCESWEERSHIGCAFFPSGELEDLGEAMNIALYRVVQEALSNVMRHAEATRVRITLTREAGPPELVRLRIEDDGRGFDSRARPAGLGLLGMRERAQMLGGRCEARPGSARGVTVECVLPVAAE